MLMTKQIEVLYQKSLKKEKLIIGLMSGTSMDGLDIALCHFSGNGFDTNIKLLHFKTADYTPTFKQQLKSIFSKNEVSLEMVCLMNEQIAIIHAQLVNDALAEWNVKAEEVDFLASHGQTIYHAPQSLHQNKNLPNGTLQIGDGDHLAVLTDIITLSDFRQKHLAAGGEGAPLAVYGDYLLFSNTTEDRVLLNIGGISNFTFLPADKNTDKIFSTDVGPGNTIMDQYVQKHFVEKHFDKNAEIASKGKCNSHLLKALLTHDFFTLDFPKTTGPELYNLNYLQGAQLQSGIVNLSHEDVLATLCHFTARAISDAIHKINRTHPNLSIYISGGGEHNPLLLVVLKKLLPKISIKSTTALGIEGDAKEAILFALLANETITGSTVNYGKSQIPSITMGKISLPS